MADTSLSESTYVQLVYNIVDLIARYTLARGQCAELESSLLNAIFAEDTNDWDTQRSGNSLARRFAYLGMCDMNTLRYTIFVQLAMTLHTNPSVITLTKPCLDQPNILFPNIVACSKT